MKIVEVKKLDDGVSGITIEGRIIRVLKPRESQYGWSQFVVIKDDTGEMGSNINIENEEGKYQGGEYIQVKGKVSIYVKGGKSNMSLNGNILDEIVKVDDDVSQEKPISQPVTQPTQKTTQKEYTNNDYWYDKTLREIENNKCIVRECAIKASTELMVAKYINEEADFFELADKIVDYIYETKSKITSEAIIKEFGGTTTEETKEERITKAQEIVKDTIPKEDIIRNPHLTEPVDNTMATVEQKKQIYGYIDEEGKKLGGIVDSKYIKEGEVNNIGKPEDLTKANAIRYWEYWYGKDQALGERDKREMTAQEKEGSPFATKRKPLELVDKNDDSSLSKDLLIEAINKLRKENALDDDAKFTKEIGCNANFKLWHESELTKLKEKLEVYRPNWVKE